MDRVLTSARPYDLRKKLDDVLYTMSLLREIPRANKPDNWYEFVFETPEGQIKLKALELDALVAVDRHENFQFEPAGEDLKTTRKSAEYKLIDIIKNGLHEKKLVTLTRTGAQLSELARSGVYKAIYNKN